MPTVPDQASLGDSPNPNRAKKAQTEINDSFSDDYQAVQFRRRPAATSKAEGTPGLNTSSYSSSSHRHAPGGAPKTSRAALPSKGAHPAATSRAFKRPRSSCSSSRSSNASTNNGLTRLRLSRGSMARVPPITMRDKSRPLEKLIDAGSRSRSDSSHPGTVSYRDSSTESLDRIHTFNLKNRDANYATQR